MTSKMLYVAWLLLFPLAHTPLNYCMDHVPDGIVFRWPPDRTRNIESDSTQKPSHATKTKKPLLEDKDAKKEPARSRHVEIVDAPPLWGACSCSVQ